MSEQDYDYVQRCSHCGTALNTLQKAKRVIELINPANRPGYVYLISDGSGLYKIGKTKDLESRMAAIRTANPMAQLLKAIKTTDCAFIERAMHARYEDKLVSGEWFALLPSDVTEICSTRDMEWEK